MFINSNTLKLQVLDACADAKEEAASSTHGTQEIVAGAVGKVPNIASILLPSESNLKRMVQRKRQKAQNVPAQPSHLHELVLPVRYQ